MDGVADFGAEEAAMQAYFRDGERRALALNNRGPIRFTSTGELHPEILDAFKETGFYVFEGALSAEELAELKAEVMDLIGRFPVERGASVDRQGRPALGVGLPFEAVNWSRPLGDPLGGTQVANGRSPVRMMEPEPAKGLPAEIPFNLMAPFQFSDAALRVYGHPQLLKIAAAINGEDFCPYAESIIIKKPGEGASFAWHQDGTTHWNGPGWTPLSHGFNFMVQIFDSKAANAVWYLPGTHNGKVDIQAAAAAAGGNRLPGAVPLICKAGDITISNRQVLHCSFPNTSPDWRVTLTMGCYPRKSVLGVETHGMDGTLQRYDEERVRKRCEMIGYAIEARRQRHPEETPFRYAPHAAAGEVFRWDDAARAKIDGYSLRDMLI
jgi:ectoine hydroxylase-related dioxygenase (phytanoyl-CoA dioxygenase family)